MYKVVFEKLNEKAEIPTYQTVGSAGADLKACLDEPLVLYKGATLLVPTGLKMMIPNGYEGQVRPRSGLALKHSVSVLNSPGTIDADYRGPIGVILHNYGSTDFTINHGDRIAQLIIKQVIQWDFVEGEVKEDTERGAGGFGSTGK